MRKTWVALEMNIPGVNGRLVEDSNQHTVSSVRIWEFTVSLLHIHTYTPPPSDPNLSFKGRLRCLIFSDEIANPRLESSSSLTCPGSLATYSSMWWSWYFEFGVLMQMPIPALIDPIWRPTLPTHDLLKFFFLLIYCRRVIERLAIQRTLQKNDC